jgi:ankyrin repeat protein
MSPSVVDVLRAAKDDDAEGLMELLSQGATATMTNGVGQTGLHVAAIWGCVEVARVLQHAGADVNAQNRFGATPLHCAAQGSHYELAQLLLDWGADTQLATDRGEKPYEAAEEERMRTLCGAPSLKLHEALQELSEAEQSLRLGGSDALPSSPAKNLEALLEQGIPLSEQDLEGNTPLHLAVKAALGEAVGEVPLIEEVDIEEVVSPSLPSSKGSASLDIILGHQSAVGLAAAQRLRNAQGLMPIHVAATAGNAAISQALLEAGAPVNAFTMRQGEYSSGWGSRTGGGNIEELSPVDKTALHLAVSFLLDQYEEDEDAVLDTSLVRTLLKHGADVNAIDLEMQSPFHIAIMGSMYEIVELLADAKADLSLSCKTFGRNNTAVHQATICRDIQMIKLLVKLGARVDATGRDGWTPLGLAVRSGATDVAKALIAAQANVNDAGCVGKTPLEIATLNNKPSLIELFTVGGA